MAALAGRILIGCLLGISVATACTLDDPFEESELGLAERAIINGDSCGEAANPSAVAILFDAELEYLEHDPPISARRIRTVFCTGTLIAPDVVLAAAHCLYPWLRTGVPGTIYDERYYVSFTADLSELAGLRLDEPAPDLPADAIEATSWVHPSQFSTDLLYSIPPGLGNLRDIGLFFLAEPVTDVAPAVVITSEEAAQIADEMPVTIVGWGQQTTERRDPLEPPEPGILGRKVCAASSVNEVSSYEMQIGDDASSARKCHGDSGGPTYMTVTSDSVAKERIVGVTSHTYDDSDCASGGVDTRVDAWLSWVDSAMESACSSDQRVWCEVSGIVPPDYDYGFADDPGGGGCSVGRDVSSPIFIALFLIWLRRRQIWHRA